MAVRKDTALRPPPVFAAAALHAVSGYSILFLQTTGGDLLVYPGYLEQEEKRKVFGRKTSADVPFDGYIEVSASTAVSFLRSCVPSIPGLDGMHTKRGPPVHLYNRAGVEALLGAKRLASFSWPDHSAYVHKPPPPPPPPAPVVPDMDLLDMLASTALDALPVAGTRLCDGRAVQMPRRP